MKALSHLTPPTFGLVVAGTILSTAGVTPPPGMVYITGGEFLTGCELTGAKRNEQPAHKVKLDGFWLDITPVINAQFAESAKATGYFTTTHHL